MKELKDLRIDYGRDSLDEDKVSADPMAQFRGWLEEALDSDDPEANAMVLSTVDRLGQPSSRVVLLRALNDRSFGFFSNYTSRKAVELDGNPQASLLFLWKPMQRQVRIEGIVEKMPAEESDAYFNGRPRSSKVGAWSSPQSATIPDRKSLEENVQRFDARFDGDDVPRPSFWGGYYLVPHRIEFWQGRPSRLHDRLVYSRTSSGEWKIERIAP